MWPVGTISIVVVQESFRSRLYGASSDEHGVRYQMYQGGAQLHVGTAAPDDWLSVDFESRAGLSLLCSISNNVTPNVR